MSQLTRKAIMKCTLELAEKKSLKKITVKDIADECGITRSTFYYHFLIYMMYWMVLSRQRLMNSMKSTMVKWTRFL